MKQFHLSMILFLMVGCGYINNSSPGTGADLVALGATLQLVSDQFAFTEGPAKDAEGNVYFTDQPNNKIWKYSTGGELSVFMDTAGRSNGLFFDAKGNLLACADGYNQLWRISPGKAVEVLVNDYQGEQLNGPNDVWENARNGNIYFTDPYYHRNYWTRTAPARPPYVYLFKNDRLTAVATDLIKPNGIVGTADGKTLYVADIGDNKTYRYAIRKDGSLSNKMLLIPHGSDGMTLDNKGNLYLTGSEGVMIHDATGKHIQTIPVPEKWTANVCFGGVANDVLFITASKSLYTIRMNVKGIQ